MSFFLYLYLHPRCLHVLTHFFPTRLSSELNVELVASLTQTETHFPAVVGAIAPQGKFALIDDPKVLDVSLLKRKSVSLHWEFMFTRAEEHTSELQSLMRISYAVFCLKKKTIKSNTTHNN